MRLELYLAETARIAHEQTGLLDEARHCMVTRFLLEPIVAAGDCEQDTAP